MHGLVLRLVDLMMAMQPTQGIVADRAQRDDLFSRIKRKRIVDLDLGNLRVERQVLGPSIMDPGGGV